MAAPSGSVLKASSSAFKLFTKSMAVVKHVPLRASPLALLSAESATSRFMDQLVVSRRISVEEQLGSLPAWLGRSGLAEEMLTARGPRKVVDSDEDDDDNDDEDDDFDAIDDLDDEDDESGDEFDDAEDDEWKKVRTRSHRDL